MSLAEEVFIRPFNPAVRGEEGYILQTWLRDLRAADASGLPDPFWFPAHRAYIQAVLGDPAATVLVAVPNEPGATEILGYVAGYAPTHTVTKVDEDRGAVTIEMTNPGVLEWVHVRKQFRRQGLARLLLRAAGIPPHAPARWRTQDSRARLPNPYRPRALRKFPSSSTGGPSPSST